MINQPIQVLKILYLALSPKWESTRDDLLGQYLSDSDPFVVGNDSADPAIFDEFVKCFKKYGSYDDYGYDFIIKYLNDLDPYYGDIKKYFLQIEKQDFIKLAEQYSQLNDREIIKLNHWEKFYPKLFKWFSNTKLNIV